jgi:large conductance mechanosensitive channel
MKELFEEFKTFLLRGNVVDLAVAVVIGAAFGAVVNSLVADIVTPTIAAVVGEPDFGALDFTINDSRFTYGNFLNTLISFVTIAAAIFFLVVKPVNLLMDRMKSQPPPDDTVRECPECLSKVPRAARKCMFCTSAIGAA